MIVSKDILESKESVRETTDRHQREQLPPKGDRNDLDMLIVNKLSCDLLRQRITEFYDCYRRWPEKIVMTNILFDDLKNDAKVKGHLNYSLEELKASTPIKTFMGVQIEIGKPTFNLELV